jgi:hypothetical protein
MWQQHRAGFIVATIAAVFMTVIGALGTDHVSFWVRLCYWLVVMETGAMIGTGITSAVQGWGRFKKQPIIEALLIALLIALPLTLAVIGTGMLFLEMDRPSPRGIAMNFGLVTFISAIITAITYGIASKPVVAETALPSKEQHSSTVRLSDRLPLAMRSQRIIALQAEDHYLRVHLEDGRSTLILMRLSDAIAELPADTGAQTHRSWWVAEDAVRAVTKSNGRATLTLTVSLEAPVSRSFYKTLSDAGWLI